jgi:peptidyl-tRNA hydrolase, PTH1 family
MKLIVGLGNPGEEYATSRHNVGFRCIRALARKHHIELDQKRSQARLGQGQIGGQAVVLARPHTYMNLSGLAVRGLLQWLRLAPSDLIVVYDDMDLPLARLRLRSSGSAGGHRGMQSIMDSLGTSEFSRIRVGIGRPEGNAAVDYVLGDFTAAERKLMEEAYSRVVEAVGIIVADGLEAAMNRFNA